MVWETERVNKVQIYSEYYEIGRNCSKLKRNLDVGKDKGREKEKMQDICSNSFS